MVFSFLVIVNIAIIIVVIFLLLIFKIIGGSWDYIPLLWPIQTLNKIKKLRVFQGSSILDILLGRILAPQHVSSSSVDLCTSSAVTWPLYMSPLSSNTLLLESMAINKVRGNSHKWLNFEGMFLCQEHFQKPLLSNLDLPGAHYFIFTDQKLKGQINSVPSLTTHTQLVSSGSKI